MIIGDNSSDEISHKKGNQHFEDVISIGGAGNDEIKSLSKYDDEIYGNEGNDRISGN